MKIIVKKTIGLILIIIGLAALFTPFTPGSWLALIGLELLGIRKWAFRTFLNDRQRTSAERFMEKIKSKFRKKTTDRPGQKQS